MCIRDRYLNDISNYGKSVFVVGTGNEGLGEGQDVYKRQVLKGEKTGYLVCCIPVDEELDLKKTAKAAGDKKVEMIPMKDLQSVTGYIRGGCSPIGMKKQFPTFVEEKAFLYPEIAISAGLRGQQIIISPQELIKFVRGKSASLV